MITRRQFLLLGGAVGGVGLSAVAQKLLATNGAANRAEISATPTLTTTPAATPSASLAAQNSLDKRAARIVVISDLNSQYGSTDYEPEVDKAIALIPTWKPDLVICGGDMVAGEDPSLSQDQVRAMWAAFDRHVSAPLRQAGIPYGFTLGNHDASSAQAASGSFLFGQERNLAAAYWNAPNHNPGLQFVDRGKFPFYYSFQQNGIFFLVWDASSADISPAQIAWAERSLASTAAQSARLRIVIGHLPLYAITIGRDDPGEYLNQAEKLRSLLEVHQVHTYISGHDHAYYPGHKGKLELLHCGILGAGVRPLLNGNLRPQKTLTIVDVNLAAANTTYTTYDMKTMELVNQKQLPKLIASPTEKVLRRDLEWADLTSEERAIEYVGSS